MKEGKEDGDRFEISPDLLDSYADLLELYGYKVQRPARDIHDEYTFERAWNLYEKKVGCKDKLKRIWSSEAWASCLASSSTACQICGLLI